MDEKEREEKRQQIIMDYKNTFTSEGGKRVLENLAFECYENSVTFIDKNALGSAFNEGKRYVILHIKRILAIKDVERQKEAVNVEKPKE